MRGAVIRVVVIVLCVIAAPAHAIDYPHFGINNIGCDSCHFIYGTQPSLLPPWTAHVPQDIDDTQYNTLCWSCHNDVDAPYVKTHSSLQTDDSYGNWTVECRVCHDPHYQDQFRKYGSASYIYSGASTNVTTNTITKADAGWTVDAYAGLVVVPNVLQKNYNYKILSNTADTLTVQGPINLTKVGVGNTFAIVYGKLINDTIYLNEITITPAKSGSKPVRFFNSTGTNSFADGNATYDGICEVCHTQTTHFRNDGTGPNQLHTNVGTPAGTDCIDCHNHVNGFAHGAGGGTGCGDATSCHGVQKSHPTHVGGSGMQLSLACSDCHDTSSFPQFKDGQNLANTTACNPCHSPGGTYDGVNDAAVGAKNNFTSGVYNGSALNAGKEKWCATCHDESPSVIGGVTAPNIVGDEDGPFNYGTGYGYYKTGHGLATNAAFPSSGGVAKGPGLKCDGCHDFSTAHIDGIARTYDASVNDGGDLYRTGYRLSKVDLGSGLINPMYLPWPDSPVSRERFALCAKCHDPQPFLYQNNDTNLISTNSNPSGVNEHSHHLANGAGMNNRYDSDWGGTYESRVSCTACHNVHGSQRLAMMRDGALEGRTPGFEVWYDNPTLVSDNSGDATPPVPQNLTLIKSTGLIMLESSTNGRMCSACHNRTFTSHYPRVTLRWKGNTPALDWTGETNYETRGIHTDRLFNTTEAVPFRVMYFDPNNDAPSVIELRIDHNDNGTYDAGETTAMVEDDPFDNTYTNGKIYKATVSLTTPGGDRKIKYRVYASDGTNEAVGQPAQDQIIEWDADFIRSVPGEYTTLQDAISIAYDGNTIVVSNGTYNENIDYGGKDLIIQSLNGAAATSITGSGSNNPVVTFSGGETSAAVLDGFTINNVDNGSNYNMNGIKISNGSTPTIKNSIITGNNMRGKGTGILIDGGAATIDNCQIYGNTSSFEQGAGLYLINGTATTTITNSSISSNASAQSGGGLYVSNSDIVLTNVTMNSNSSSGSTGGGAYFTGDVNAVISGGSISSNTSKYSGAGLYFDGSGAGSLSISGATINSNLNTSTSPSNGAGLYLGNIGSTTTITNTTINSNIAKTNGGGMYLNNAPVTLTGSTISGNSVNDSSGGGIWSNSSMTINSCVITSNIVNHSPDRGGGLNLSGAASIVNINNTTINSNRAPGSAGIHFTGLELNIVGGSVSGNTGTAQIDGGGIYAGSGTVSLYGVYVQSNQSGHGGGGIYSAVPISVTNCIITGNASGGNYWAQGGGLVGSPATVLNSTIVGNRCTNDGGGVLGGGGTVKNSIVYGNYAGRYGSNVNNATVSYTDINGGGYYTDGGNNINSDPLFVNGRPYSEAPTTAGDYHLKNASPVKGQATSTGAPADDIDGNARPQEGSYDMGADEYIPVAPAAPTIGTPSALSSTSVRWNFTDNADNETGFKVHDGSHSIMASSATPNLTYLDETGLTPNTQYTRHVHAYNALGDSSGSADASGYTLAEPPTSPAATDGTYADRINVSWSASSSASHYHVYRDGAAGAGTLVFNSTGTSFDDSITAAHTYYIYSVNADDQNSASYISDNGYTSGDPDPPTASNLYPANGATGISIDSNVTLTVSDAWSGVDWTTFDITLTGSKGYSKHYTDLDTAIVTKSGTASSYNVTINPDTDFSTAEQITVTVTSSDLAGNAMSAPAWSFLTQLFPPGTYTVCKTGHADAPCDYQTIQNAINGVSNGNTVMVSADTYSENINFNGKNITIRSRNGAASTTIQGASGTNLPVVTFASGETSSAVLDGFTIDNQYSNSSTRGIRIASSARPTIDNCVVKGNVLSSGDGAGIYIYYASAIIHNTTIGGDAAAKNSSSNGAGLYAAGLTQELVIDGCTISENTANVGGGIYLYSNGVTQTSISNTTFVNNSAVNGGGAIYDNSSKLTITGSGFTTNSSTNAGSGGGAINFYNSIAGVTMTISGSSTFSGNTAGYRGGAIYASTATNATPISITNCSFTGNSNTNMGGAIYSTGGTSQWTITDSTFTGNSTYIGGAIASESSPLTITNTVMNNNTGTGSGGGIYIKNASATTTITGGTINGNVGQLGGGIATDTSVTLNVIGTTISGNSATGSSWGPGGGINVAGSSTVNLTKVYVKGNSANHYGGGIYNASGTTTLTNCMVTGNVAKNGNHGGGIFNDSTLRVYSSTLAGNYAATYGGGLFNNSGDTATITNSILWDDTAGTSGHEIYNNSGTLMITYSDVEGGWAGTGNINSDPLFVTPAQASSGTPTTAGDFHIQSGSLCKDVGTLTGAPIDDIDGDSRPYGAGIDMGSDEYVP